MSFIRKLANLFSKKETQITPMNHQPRKVLDDEVTLSPQKFEINRLINNGGLTIEEILMLALIEEKDTNNDFFPGFWQYSYNVNPKLLFANLIKKGFYLKEKSLTTTLERKTVDELKEILRKHNLKVSGRKQELIDRILNELCEEELNSIELIEVYKRNEKAKEIIEKNEHIIFFHRNQTEISIYEAHDFKNKNPHYSPVEIARELIDLKAKRHIANKDWGLYRNTRVSLAEIEIKEQNFDIALALLFEVCYLDLSGMSNNFDLNFLYIYEDRFFPYEKSIHTLAPGIVNYIRKLKVKLELTDENLKHLYLSTMHKYQVPFHLFTKEETANILIAEINNDVNTLKEIYKTARKRYFNKSKYGSNKKW
ncbi:SAP domain protein [Anoxybacillus sp. B7M1]|uniref:SAP domain-containing protein n=1 Tax=unclassified Anoxybacillus TaxID=2639704 RepID=UPI0005CDC2DA|nr:MULTISPECIES: SAP domain-containing protein [unclassified Anoxybacillus]ANB58577.1 SAP domain protein [Anoxybacillus sp. B2M1]ANB63274.1 SAP domain protein [Anoxybacillus sp. B7M1]